MYVDVRERLVDIPAVLVLSTWTDRTRRVALQPGSSGLAASDGGEHDAGGQKRVFYAVRI